MNPAIRTNSQVALSLLRESMQVGQAVIDTIGRQTRGASRVDAHRPRGLRTALRVAGTLHHRLYLRTGGKIGGTLRGGPVLLLTTTGRKSGRDRTRPLSYLHDGDDLVLVASAAGSPNHPAWYLNLLANPRVTIRQGNVTRTMMAHGADRSTRARLWQRVVQQYPVAARYQRRTGREFPIVILRPIRAADPRSAATLWLRGGGMSQLLIGARTAA